MKNQPQMLNLLHQICPACHHKKPYHIWSIFSRFWGALDLDIFPSEMLRGCLDYAICNSNSFHFFLFKPCILILCRKIAAKITVFRCSEIAANVTVFCSVKLLPTLPLLLLLLTWPFFAAAKLLPTLSFFAAAISLLILPTYAWNTIDLVQDDSTVHSLGLQKIFKS